MSTYLYSALDPANSYVKGSIDALNQKKAKAKLEGEGFLVVNIQKKRVVHFIKLSKISTISRLDKIFFTRHLYTFLEAGIALDHAIKIASEQTNNLKFKDILENIYKRIEKGQKLFEALALYPKQFSEFYINLVKIGEASGTLDQSLSHLLEQQEKDHELLSKTRSAMIYPSIIILAAIVMVTFMMTFVIPTIATILIEYGGELPWTTKVLIWLSNFIVHYGLILAPILLVLIYLFTRLIKTESGQWYWENFLFRLPFIKRIMAEFNLARFARSMSAMLKSGLSIDKALEMSARVCSNKHYQKSILESVKFIHKGVALTEVLQGYPELYPPLTTRMVEIGERTGKFDSMFNKVAIFYEKSVITTFSNLSSVVEPLLILFIGLIVGFVAVSILTPIWKFAESI